MLMYGESFSVLCHLLGHSSNAETIIIVFSAVFIWLTGITLLNWCLTKRGGGGIRGIT